MMVTYSCEKCQHVFDGHWHEEEARRKQFPQFSHLSRHEVTRVCPECGHYNKRAKNLDDDEELTEESFEGDE